MTDLEFSAIIEVPEEIQALQQLMDEFKTHYGTTVKIRQMGWDNAWSELLAYSLYGKEPDVSHIGSTWCSSLVEMNALRVFKLTEVAQLGGREAFIKPAWQSTYAADDTRIWSVPWTGYANVLAYRRDLYEQAGLTKITRLESVGGVYQAVNFLKSTGVKYPWLMPTTGNVDLLHAAASWVWEAGGEFIDVTNKKILFNEPAAMAGFRNYFELFRCLPAPVEPITATECANLFAEGQAGLSLINSKSLLEILRLGNHPEVIENLGTAALSRTPWFGGGNLVIWKHNQYNVEKEHASVNLIRFLTSTPIQVAFTQKADEIPVTLSALQTAFPMSHPLSLSLQRTVLNGKPYRATHMWGRIEKLLGQALETIAAKVREDPNCDIKTILFTYLDPLARRLESTLTTS